MVMEDDATYLLHDASLPLGEGDVPTRLVLDELDLNLSSLTATLLVIIVIIVGGGRGSRSFGAPRLAIACRVLARRALIQLRRIGDVGHGDGCHSRDFSIGLEDYLGWTRPIP